MIQVFIILVIIVLFYLFWANKKQKDIPLKYNNNVNPIKGANDKPGKYVPSGIIKTRQIEKEYFRKTYLKGVFIGKFKGKYNDDLTNDKSNWYDLIHLDSNISVDEKDVIKYTEEEKQILLNELLNHKNELNFAYPDKLLTEINKGAQYKEYFLKFKEKQLTNIEFYHTVKDGDNVYVTIKGDFLGYTEHPEIVIEEEEYQEMVWELIKEKDVTYDLPTDESLTDSKPVIYTRTPIENSKIGFWQIIGGILTAIFVVYSILQFGLLLFFGWPILLVFVGFYLLNLISSFIFSSLRWLGKILMWFIIVGLISMFLSAFVNYKNVQSETETYVPENEPIETVNPVKNSFVKNKRIWKDYDGNIYSGTFILSQNSIVESLKQREIIPSSNDYNNVIYNLYSMQPTQIGLKHIHHMFDSIQVKQKLSRTRFAEMIVTCIQDIPYTLVLTQQCDPEIYNDRFIYDYLNAGNKCEPNVKFGIYSPVEFAANLVGDCDTRTVLLYSILKKYNYDVVILGSEEYGHSILGINLPYKGIYKMYNNKKYVVWETTAPGIIPGVLPREISNMNNWEINLK